MKTIAKPILAILIVLTQTLHMDLYAQTKTGYAPVNGLKMYYEVHGEGTPLVLIHGSFMTIPDNWEQVIPLFKNRKIIVAEMQGHGRTADIPRQFSYEAMADDISALLKHLQIDSADVLGYSMGGGVAFQMGIRHPQQVKKLVILSGAYKNDGWWPEVEKSFATIDASMFKGSPIEEAYNKLSPHPEKFDAFIQKTMSPDLKPYDWTEDVRKMNVPIFLVIGDSDGIRYEHANDLMRMKGGAKMGDFGEMSSSRMAVLPGTTHIGMMMRTNWWIPMTEDFLDGKQVPNPFAE
ncbi:alpha/beta fold hydrolase [Olivibacter domesticus]|uniref:Pimeloyl-ACP methyl ester carboxylesterase n=1 Tax=Olivibacter domesticus TaxID=407022 RepID=A0A1H7R562_OLID1|nr:alpha/beta hydrolase [Olivibacter domesticus]SEL55371.1 Pimeloyl-ACP methyl ester carboxylesterase [Olivibacter domesticus]